MLEKHFIMLFRCRACGLELFFYNLARSRVIPCSRYVKLTIRVTDSFQPPPRYDKLPHVTYSIPHVNFTLMGYLQRVACVRLHQNSFHYTHRIHTHRQLNTRVRNFISSYLFCVGVNELSLLATLLYASNLFTMNLILIPTINSIKPFC